MKLRTTKLRDPSVLDRTKADFTVQHIRGSGPGGQHRNKVATGVRITDTITGITASATDSRSQTDNKARAFQKLVRALLAHYEREQHEDEERRQSAGWSAKIRTYHEPRGVVVDHRTGERRRYIDVLDGDIEGFGMQVDSRV